MTSAQSAADSERLAVEQAALRRVATLVARESSPTEVFEAVTREAAQVLRTAAVGLLRFENDETATLVAQSDTPWDPPPLGTRFTLDGDNVVVRARRTGQPARDDDWTSASGSVAAMADVLGVRSSVATPIVVEGRTWGVLIAATDQPDPLPPGTELRVLEFTELVATAIANAEARSQLARLVAEQAALRKVATLVAENPASAGLFSTVAHEVVGLLNVSGGLLDRFQADDKALHIIRFEDDSAVIVGTSRGEGSPFPVGFRFPLGGENVSSRVFRTGEPARMTNYARTATGPIGRMARPTGVRTAVAVPVAVDGRLWGTMLLASYTIDELPPDTEKRLQQFAELTATAIANAESRREIERLAEEQAALRRMATLVARGVPAQEVFSAVSDEVARLFGTTMAAVGRFDHDEPALLIVGAAEQTRARINIGSRFELDEALIATRVYRTGRSARIGPPELDSASPKAAEFLSRINRMSSVSSPIVANGSLWGVITVTSETELLPPDTQERLEKFTDLVATALANAEARDEIERLVDEQAALRRVATLVAQGVPAQEVFSAVSDEVARLFGTTVAAVGRFDHEEPALVVVGAAEQTRARVKIGSRLELDDALSATRVYRTGRSAWIGPREVAFASPEVAEFLSQINVASSVSSPIVVNGRLWGVITVTSETGVLPPDTQERLEKFTELVATALANADTRRELIASRARIVAASDDARRRIERDLHDGAQQRLVSLGLELRIAAEGLPDPLAELNARLGHVADEIDGVIDDLREMSRGIHPTVLSDGGLCPAVETLARRAPVPVELDLGVPARFPPQVEVALYYVVSEALTNTAKHANASRARVLVEHCASSVRLSIDDDGDGGATLHDGSGLAGLRDRVEALGGSFSLSSPPGKGTVLNVELPLTSEQGSAVP